MPWYADQLKTYMAIHGRSKGRIAIMHIMGDYSRGDDDIRGNGPEPELAVYELEWRDPSAPLNRSEEHTSELQSLMRISYAVFCLTQKLTHTKHTPTPKQH